MVSVEVLEDIGGQELDLPRGDLGCINSSQDDEERWVQGTRRGVFVTQLPYLTTSCPAGPHGDPYAGWALGGAPGSGEAVSPVEQIPSSRQEEVGMVSRSPLEESTGGRGAKAKQRVGHGCVQTGLQMSVCHQQSWSSLAGGPWGRQTGWGEGKHHPFPKGVE